MRVLRSPGSYDEVSVSMAAAVFFEEEDYEKCPTQQSLRDEVDINTIVRRFGVAAAPAVAGSQGVYGDFTGITDYESALEMVERVRADFMRLPANLRERYGNDPGRFLASTESMSDDELDALTAPGPSLEPPAAPPAPPAPPVAPPAPPAA